MNIPKFTEWPVFKQIKSGDPHALGHNAMSERTRTLEPRTRKAERVVNSVSPNCAHGCRQLVYQKDQRILDIEADPDSPISRGCLCPKGSATFQLVTNSYRVTNVLYRRPYGTEWEVIPLAQAMEMVAQRIKKSRDDNWQVKTDAGETVNRTLSLAHLGGATWDNEENYLLKKLYSALGIVQVENQARI
jgi:formate dehydrogenase major subunit